MGFMKIIRAGKHLCHLYIAFKSFHSVKIHINDFCPFIVVVPALTTRNNKDILRFISYIFISSFPPGRLSTNC